jgi:membrane fusion protein (multidrug efflux system)
MRLFIPGCYLLLIAIAVFSCDSKEEQPAGGRRPRLSGPMSVDAFVVRQSTISEDVEVPGTLRPFEETAIRAEVGGRVVQMNIREGSSVEKGTLLVKLFDEDLKAQLRKLKVQLQIREKTAERNRELLEINGISQQEYDLSTLEVENLRADIESTEIAISKTEIRAPYRGVVGLRNISLGSYISPSDIVTTIRQVDQLKLEFSVPEKYAKDIGKGYAVRFRVDGGTQDHTASVIATENNVDQNTRTLQVRAVVSGKKPELVPGLFAKVNLQLGKNDKAILVPTEAVIPTIRNKQVVLLRGDTAKFTVVETGLRDSAYIEILNGVNVGDTVITTGLMAIRPETRVKITNVTSL